MAMNQVQFQRGLSMALRAAPQRGCAIGVPSSVISGQKSPIFALYRLGKRSGVGSKRFRKSLRLLAREGIRIDDRNRARVEAT